MDWIKKIDWDQVKEISLVILVFGFIVFILYVMVAAGIQDGKDNNFCDKNYPTIVNDSVLDYDWAETRNVQDDFLRCCRKYLENHEYKTECDIFERK